MNNPNDTGVNKYNMNQFSKFYKDKLIAYLDHNILDRFVKNKMKDFFHQLKEEFQVVYSNDNLKEILRSGDKYYKDFLQVLLN